MFKTQFSQIFNSRTAKNSPGFAIYPTQMKLSAFTHYYWNCDVNLKNTICELYSPQECPIIWTPHPKFSVVYKEA